MIPALGRLSLLLALVVAVYTVVAAVLGDRRQRPALVDSARNGIVAAAVLMTLAAACLLFAFATHDFSLRYVAEQSSRDMPRHFTLAAFYGGQAGSLLFWAWTLSLVAAAAVVQHQRRHPRLFPYVVATLAGIESFFVLLLVRVTNPFERLPFVPPDGRGLNPLLYDEGMLIHPPLLLMGYMSSSVPFAFAVAALITGRLDREWLAAVRRWVLTSWAILGSGLVLGAWWAYHVLGWGGYWGWDPVENVALLPWLTSTAFLHSAMVQERRGMLKVWNVGLVLATFALSIFGTFVVRSGVLVSVHSFALSAIGPYFFAFLGLVLLGSVGLLFYRLPRMQNEGAFDSALSRESSFLVNNLLLVGVAFATFWGTIFPLVSEALRGVKVAVGPPFFNQVNGPLLIGLLILMAIGPLLAWRRAAPAALWRLLRWPLTAAVVAAAVLLLLGARSVGALLGFAACALAGGTIVVEYARAIRLRRRGAEESVLQAFVTLLARNRRRYGGYLVHAAVVCIAVGVVGSSFFQREAQATVASGEQFGAGRYRFTFRGLVEYQEPGIRVVYADVRADGAGLPGGAIPLRPEKRFHRNWEQQPSTRVAISTIWPWVEDIYVYLAGWDEQGRATLHVFVNPLVPLIWFGLLTFWAGAAVVMWPEVRAPVVRVARLATEAAR